MLFGFISGVLAQIRILITAEDNSHAKEKKEKRHINLRCRVTDTTDIHIKCQDLWWTREIDQVNHKEVVIGHMKTQSFLTGYQTKLSVHPPKEQSQEVYSCHALCGLQTFTATCHLMDLKSKSYLYKGYNSWIYVTATFSLPKNASDSSNVKIRTKYGRSCLWDRWSSLAIVKVVCPGE